MERIIRVPISKDPYDVVVRAGLLGDAGRLAAQVIRPGRCAVVTDSHVGPVYAKTLVDSLEKVGFSPVTVTVPAGEESKSLEQTGIVCEDLIRAGLDRSSSIFALGGGVVGDLAGFVAAVYFRGIPFIQVPTSVVAQVDSSVGGKTGVNARGGKNLIGSFHQPRLVLADTDTLATLPPREFHQGFAEIIKHAAIRDPEMLDAMDDLSSLVARNIAIKAKIVGQDEFETSGLRALLNFGHTLGHAIENAAGYGRFLHGEAISLGLVAACRLSVEKSGLSDSDAARVIDALKHFNLPTVLPDDVGSDAIQSAWRSDKKFQQGSIRFVLLRRLGEAFLSTDVSDGDLVRMVRRLREAD